MARFKITKEEISQKIKDAQKPADRLGLLREMLSRRQGVQPEQKPAISPKTLEPTKEI